MNAERNLSLGGLEHHDAHVLHALDRHALDCSDTTVSYCEPVVYLIPDALRELSAWLS
jgi:hypothetical protein